MTIRSKLQISTFLQILMVITVGLVIMVTFRHINYTNSQSVAVAKINESISELRFVGIENLLHHDERSLQQWQTKYEQVSTELASLPALDPQQEAIRTDMQKQQFEIKSIFDRLVKSYGEQAVSIQHAPSELQERLASQLLVKQQAQIAGANKLVSLNREITANLLVRSNWLTLAIIILMLLVMVVNSTVIIATIARSFDALRRGAGEIARGRLRYRVALKQTDDEFHSLGDSFNSMAENLEQVDKMKSEFVMLASHQLRTPATAVKGFISLLLGGYWGKLTPDQTKRLKSADAENDAQLKTIDQILEVVKIEAGKTESTKSPTDMSKLIDQVLERQKDVVENAEQTVVVERPERPIMLSVDEELLGTALDALVDNASKYSPKGSRIELLLKSTELAVIIQVKDVGYGIPLADQDKLFKRFSQIKNPKANIVGGSGLGLYLAKNIVELHGGTITVSSSENHGSTFTIELPTATKEP